MVANTPLILIMKMGCGEKLAGRDTPPLSLIKRQENSSPVSFYLFYKLHRDFDIARISVIS